MNGEGQDPARDVRRQGGLEAHVKRGGRATTRYPWRARAAPCLDQCERSNRTRNSRQEGGHERAHSPHRLGSNPTQRSIRSAPLALERTVCFNGQVPRPSSLFLGPHPATLVTPIIPRPSSSQHRRPNRENPRRRRTPAARIVSPRHVSWTTSFQPRLGFPSILHALPLPSKPPPTITTTRPQYDSPAAKASVAVRTTPASEKPIGPCHSIVQTSLKRMLAPNFSQTTKSIQWEPSSRTHTMSCSSRRRTSAQLTAREQTHKLTHTRLRIRDSPGSGAPTALSLPLLGSSQYIWPFLSSLLAPTPHPHPHPPSTDSLSSFVSALDRKQNKTKQRKRKSQGVKLQGVI